MKNNSKSITTFTLMAILAFANSLMAQMDQQRMDRDIRVASSVLQTLSQGDDAFMMYGENVTGEYIEGYGVMFSIGGQYSFIAPRRVRGFGSKSTVGTTSGRSQVIVKQEGSGGAYTVAPVDIPPPPPKVDPESTLREIDDVKDLMTTFLVDYSQLIGQLKPDDKIVISTKKSDYFYYIKPNDENQEVHINKMSGAHGLTAELLKKDHEAYITGKIKRDQLLDKINFIEHQSENTSSKDLDMFAGMLRTLYNPEYTETYFISWTPEYEVIPSVGAVYSFRVYSSYDDQGLYQMPGVDQTGITEAERNEKVKELYPKFVEEFKQNLIQYGRSISSLEDGEMVMIRITMTKCNDCNLPTKLQFTVKQSVLKGYNQGRLKLEDAVAAVKFSEL